MPSFFFLFSYVTLCTAIIVSTPEECGGIRVMTHAMAFFGPRPSDWKLEFVAVFAPHAQANGVYLTPNEHNSMQLSTRETLSTADDQRRNLFIRAHCVLKHMYNKATGQPVAKCSATTGILQRGDHPSSSAAVHTMKLNKEYLNNAPLLPPHISTQSVKTDQQPYIHTSFSSLFPACKQLSNPQERILIKNRIAVIRRGDCSFPTKIRHMQDAGAVGVIVVNHESVSGLVSMKLDETFSNKTRTEIPAVMISYQDWESLTGCLSQTTVKFCADGEASFDIDYGREGLSWAILRGFAWYALCQLGISITRHARQKFAFTRHDAQLARG